MRLSGEARLIHHAAPAVPAACAQAKHVQALQREVGQLQQALAEQAAAVERAAAERDAYKLSAQEAQQRAQVGGAGRHGPTTWPSGGALGGCRGCCYWFCARDPVPSSSSCACPVHYQPQSLPPAPSVPHFAPPYRRPAALRLPPLHTHHQHHLTPASPHHAPCRSPWRPRWCGWRTLCSSCAPTS